ARRGRRSDDPRAGIFSAGQIRVRAGTALQRVLSPLSDSQRGRPRPAALARRRGRSISNADDASAGLDGDRSSDPDVIMAHIAITTCARLEDYKQAILHAGGDVHIVDSSMSVNDALKGMDGLLLTGGDDVAPTRYGEETHPAVKAVPPERDEFEIALVREARQRDLPILAICRGIQVLNVAAGGSLVQDIPTQVTGALEHKQTVPPHQPFDLAHEVWLEKDSLLAKLMRERLIDADSVEVN